MTRITTTLAAAALAILSVAGCDATGSHNHNSGSSNRPHYDTVTTFLMFQNGDAEGAITFYISLFDDAKITRIERYGPDDAGPEGKVVHAAFTLAGRPFIAFDSPVPHPFDFTPSISLFITSDNQAEFDRLYESLVEGGMALMPPADYGFSRRYAWVNDRFGVSWQINLGGIAFDRDSTRE
jgi:predicted 3-demethylubiquinone-9 3-methyltransferase (glyoxalase superfamily)